jgi:hypothetical protein
MASQVNNGMGEVGPGIVSYPLRRYLLDSSRGKRRDYWPFIYAVRFAGLNALAINTDTVQAVTLDTDAPFLWLGTMGADTMTVGAGHLNNATLMVRIGGSGGKAWARTAPTWRNVVGYRPQPCMLPSPLLIPAGSEFHCTLRLQVVTTNVAAWLMFVGLKVYGWGPNNAAA